MRSRISLHILPTLTQLYARWSALAVTCLWTTRLDRTGLELPTDPHLNRSVDPGVLLRPVLYATLVFLGKIKTWDVLGRPHRIKPNQPEVRARADFGCLGVTRRGAAVGTWTKDKMLDEIKASRDLCVANKRE
ncbi:hypothetical protein IWZ00DRAFT_488313 [Phyllosticta capitalensis]|uniref:uncharacterized protein n=1 Tax=Phyllosticta capitalensis TaxID=121624 RepID=UPI00312EAB11